jgi:hypothetical protein
MVGLPIAASILVATALAIHLPAAIPWRETLVDLSRNLAVLIVLGAYVGATWQMATSCFYSEHPLDVIGPGLIVMGTTALLPVACLFAGLWWAGIPIGENAGDVVARLRWFFAVLPGIQVAIWGSAAALGRLL